MWKKETKSVNGETCLREWTKMFLEESVPRVDYIYEFEKWKLRRNLLHPSVISLENIPHNQNVDAADTAVTVTNAQRSNFRMTWRAMRRRPRRESNWESDNEDEEFREWLANAM